MKSSNVSRALPFVVTALLLVVCLLLPLLFLPGNDDSVPDSTGADISERAALYYRYTTDDSLQLRRLDESEVDNDAYIECVRTIETITNQLIMDEGELRSDGASGAQRQRREPAHHGVLPRVDGRLAQLVYNTH